MRTVAAREAKNEFGRLLDTAQREPVTIERYGRPVAVVLSIEDYERFEALDDAYWAARWWPCSCGSCGAPCRRIDGRAHGRRGARGRLTRRGAFRGRARYQPFSNIRATSAIRASSRR